MAERADQLASNLHWLPSNGHLSLSDQSESVSHYSCSHSLFLLVECAALLLFQVFSGSMRSSKYYWRTASVTLFFFQWLQKKSASVVVIKYVDSLPALLLHLEQFPFRGWKEAIGKQPLATLVHIQNSEFLTFYICFRTTKTYCKFKEFFYY